MADQAANEPQEEKPQQQVKITPAHNTLTWVLVGLVVLLLAGSGYLWIQLSSSKKEVDDLKKKNQALQSQIDLQKGEEPKKDDGDDKTACTYTPAAAFKDNIKAALDSENTAAFATYVTNPVKYVLAASEMGGNRTPEQAATDLEYTNSATGPWSYVTTHDYGTGDYADYFGDNTLVLKSTDGMVVAFEFNCDGSKITEIFVAPDEELL